MYLTVLYFRMDKTLSNLIKMGHLALKGVTDINVTVQLCFSPTFFSKISQ